MRAPSVFLLASLLAATLSSPALGQAPTPSRIPIQFKRAELSDIVDRLAPALGERFIYDESLAGVVTITVPRPVSPDEAWQLLHAALAMKGFGAFPIPAGGYKIVPLARAGDADPWTLAAPSPVGESRILTLIPIYHLPVDEVIALIAPLLDPTTIVLPSRSTNSLIIATTERRVAGISSLVRGLDIADAIEPELRTLRERDAATALDVIQTRYGSNAERDYGVRAWLDERTNSVIYRAPPAQRAEIAELLDQLDEPTEAYGELSVIVLRHAEATKLADQIREFADAAPDPASGQSFGLAGSSFSIAPDVGTQALVVRASPEVMATIRDIVADLDRPPKQVAVDILVQEWAYNRGFRLALGGVTAIGDSPTNSVWIQANPAGDFRNLGGSSEAIDDSFSVRVLNAPHQLQLLAKEATVDTATLLRPTLILLSGEEQALFVGNNIPVPVAPTESGTGTNAFRQETTIERRNVGIDLRLRAIIGENGATQLEVDLHFEGLRSSLTGDPEELGPTFTQRNVQTKVELLRGQALLIAGDTEGFVEHRFVGIPYLMDIPFIGQLFSARSEVEREGRIVIAIQAYPLPDAEALVEHTIRRRLAFERANGTSEALDSPEGAAFSLRIATELEQERALRIAHRHGTDAHPGRVVAWSTPEADYYDVHLVGYRSYQEAADAAYRLSEAGLVADVTPLSATSLATH